MVHGDERGLKLPPKVAPVQCVIVPIAPHKAGVSEKAREIFSILANADIRVEIDEREQSPGWKFNEWELKGVPVRLEIGPRDIENGNCVLARRDTNEKETCSLDGIEKSVADLLEKIQKNMLETARQFREEHTFKATNWQEFMRGIEEGHGFVKAMWCGDKECEAAIKEETGVTTRCMPFDGEQEHLSDVCVHCGKPAKKMTIFAKAY